MAFNFNANYPNGLSPLTRTGKEPQVKAVKLSASDFTTGGTASVKMVLPKEASIFRISAWTKTTFSGNGVTAVALQIGVSGTVAKYLSSSALSLTSGSGSQVYLTNVSNIFQNVGDETSDIRLLFTGTATTGNPTAGEAYVLIEYVI